VVPSGAIYGSTHAIDLTDVRIDGAAAQGDTALQVVAYPGDTTGDRRYTALDGQRINRIIAGLDTGLGSYLAADPVIVGDVDGDGRLTASDAMIISRESQFLLTGARSFDRLEIPPIPDAKVAATTLPALAAPSPAVLPTAAPAPAVSVDWSASPPAGLVLPAPAKVAEAPGWRTEPWVADLASRTMEAAPGTASPLTAATRALMRAVSNRISAR
jgi:hypothetical protein